MILDKFFLKYESGWGFKLTPPLPPEKTCLKKPRLIRVNGVCSGIKLSKIRDGANDTNLDKFKSIGIHLIALYVNGNNTF